MRADARALHLAMHNVCVLRALGLIVVVYSMFVGAVMLVSEDVTARLLGSAIVLTGCTWLTIDVLRRRRVI
jgi:hypothetical protein